MLSVLKFTQKIGHAPAWRTKWGRKHYKDTFAFFFTILAKQKVFFSTCVSNMKLSENNFLKEDGYQNSKPRRKWPQFSITSQLSCLRKKGFKSAVQEKLRKPIISLFLEFHSCSEMNENESTNSARYLVKRLRDPTSLIWQAQKVLLNSLNKVS